MCSARDEPNPYGTADEHPADARRAVVDGALRVDVPLVDAADALQVDVGGLPQADGRRDARVDLGAKFVAVAALAEPFVLLQVVGANTGQFLAPIIVPLFRARGACRAQQRLNVIINHIWHSLIGDGHGD